MLCGSYGCQSHGVGTWFAFVYPVTLLMTYDNVCLEMLGNVGLCMS